MDYLKELELVAIISVKKSYIWLNIWAKGKKGQKNAITSQKQRVYSHGWNKKQGKANKIVFLMIYTFVYLMENVFPKYALIFQTLPTKIW